MKMVAEKQNVSRQGVQVESQFQIKTTGKAFRILSDGLYSDKVRAIIRELSCNASDAHRFVGKSKEPFHVQLPNRLEPEFVIRDFGPGLSHEDVMSIYTTYFESTKTHSNAYVGCLGLGSKSPFSYTDSFTVISIYDGVKRVYTAFINENEIPTIALNAEDKTDEPDGIEVRFGVQERDIYTFEDKAKYVYEHFRIKPKVTGVARFSIPEKEYTLKGKKWAIRKNCRSKAVAIMGDVAYPLSSFPESLPPESRAVLDIPIDITFGIGDLDMSASREDLSYNKTTIKNIKDRLAEIVKEIRVIVENSVSKAETEWEAKCEFRKLKEFELGNLFRIFEEIKWNGKKITLAHISIPSNQDKDVVDYPDIEVVCFHRESARYSHNGYSAKKNFIRSFEPSYESAVFINDLETGSQARSRQVLMELSDPSNSRSFIYSRVYLIKVPNHTVRQKLAELLGMKHIPGISTIPKNKKIKTSTNSYVNPKNFQKVLKYEVPKIFQYSTKATEFWQETEIDIHIGGVWTPIHRYKVKGQMPHQYVTPYLTTLKVIGADIPIVVGVKNGMGKKFEASKKWITIEEYTKQKLIEYLEKNNIEEVLQIKRAYDSMNYEKRQFTENVKTMLGNYSKPDSIITKFIELVKSYHKPNIIIDKIYYHLVVFKLTDEKSNQDMFKSLIEEINKKYPLLQYFDSCSFGKSNFRDAVHVYVQEIESSLA